MYIQAYAYMQQHVFARHVCMWYVCIHTGGVCMHVYIGICVYGYVCVCNMCVCVYVRNVCICICVLWVCVCVCV